MMKAKPKLGYIEVSKIIDGYVARVKAEHDLINGYAAATGGLHALLTMALTELAYDNPERAEEIVSRMGGK